MCGVWEKVPLKWQQYLMTLSDEELTLLPTNSAQVLQKHEHEDGCPQDLLTLLEASSAAQAWSAASEQRAAPTALPPPRASPPPLPISRWLEVGLNPKKAHEVKRLAPLVAKAAFKSGADAVIDFGGGLGYLGAVLAFHYGLRVICIEGDAGLVGRGMVRSQRVVAKMKKPTTRPAAGGGGGGTSGSVNGGCKAEGENRPPTPHTPPVSSAFASSPTTTTKGQGAAASTTFAPAVMGGGGGSFQSIQYMVPMDVTFATFLDVVGPHLPRTGGGGGGAGGGDGDGGAAAPSDNGGGERPVDGRGGNGEDAAAASPPCKLLLVALHACGDLTPTLLRLFAEGTAAAAAAAAATSPASAPPAAATVGVVSLGCCYHRSTGGCMSKHGDGCRANGALGSVARHVAQQAIARWPPPHTTIAFTRKLWRKHYFRCLLELRLDQLKGGGGDGTSGTSGDGSSAAEATRICGALKLKYADYKSKIWRENQRNRGRATRGYAEDTGSDSGAAAAATVGGGSSTEKAASTGCLSGAGSHFIAFAAAELESLGIDVGASVEERRKLAAIEEADDHEHALRCIHTLRGALTPLLERFIALDRASFLQEHAHAHAHALAGGRATVELIPVFDPHISPRCTAIVGLVS